MAAQEAPKTPRVPSRATSKASGKRLVRGFLLIYTNGGDQVELPAGWTPFAATATTVFAYKDLP